MTQPGDGRTEGALPPPAGMTGPVLAGGAWTSANILLPYVLTSLVSIVAARVLGPAEMGRQSFIAFVTLAGTIACSAGLPLALTRSLGESLGQGTRAALPGLVRRAWLVETPLALVGMTVLLVAAAAGAEPRAAWALAALTVLAGSLATVPQAALAGALEWKAYAIVVLWANVAVTGLTLAALAAGFGITGIVAARLVQTAAMAIWTSFALRSMLRRTAPDPVRSPPAERRMVRYAAGSSLSVILMLIVYQRSELFFLNHFSPDAEIAHYAIASSALTILLAVPQAIGVALTPAFSSLHGAGQLIRIRIGFSKALRVSGLGVVVLLGLAATVGPPLIVAVYGDAYREVQTVFLILLPTLLAAPLIAVSSAVLVSHGLVRAPLLAVGAAAIVDLLAAYLLVPRYGAPGAAGANLAALTVAATLQLAYALRVVRSVDVDIACLLRAVLASGLATVGGLAVVRLLPGPLDLLVALLVFVLLLSASARALGIARVDDARWLTAFAQRAHPRAGRILSFVLLR